MPANKNSIGALGLATAEIARLLNLMKQVDDAFNLRDYDRFLDQLHSEDVKVIQFGSESTLSATAS
jgi:hypothetical protein